MVHRAFAWSSVMSVVVFAAAGCTPYQEQQAGMAVLALYGMGMSGMAPGAEGFDAGVQGNIYSDGTQSVEGLLSFAMADADNAFQTTIALSEIGDGTGTTELALGCTGKDTLPRSDSDWFAFSQHFIWRAASDGSWRIGWATGYGLAHITSSIYVQFTPQVRILVGNDADDNWDHLVSLTCVARLGFPF